MLKLRRLKVEKFRSLVRGTELMFSDGINVLLGQNGTGKTTLLELISMVVRSDFSSLAKEAFSLEYELADAGQESIIVVVRNELTDQARAQPLLGTREVFRPFAEVRGGANRRLLLRYDAEHGSSLEDGTPQESGDNTPVDQSFLAFFIDGIPELAARLTRSLIELSSACRLDESLDLFKRITSKEDAAGDILIEGSEWFLNPFLNPSGMSLVPREIVNELKRSYQHEKPDYSFTHSELKFLAGLKDMMGFSAADIRMDVTDEPRSDSIQVGNLMFRFRWADGSLITHERLSYGQKRLVAFFYYLASNPAVVIADELVNGLHHHWITASIDAIGLRQAFLTSQNPLLLDYVPVASPAEAQQSFVLCRGEPREGKPGWVWENMSDEDAAALFSAHEVGIEHVSEILQSRGLW